MPVVTDYQKIPLLLLFVSLTSVHFFHLIVSDERQAEPFAERYLTKEKSHLVKCILFSVRLEDLYV